MPNNAHLTQHERSIISVRLTEGASFRQIAAELDKDPGTISREIKKHRVSEETGAYGRAYNPCIHRRTCEKTNLCKTCTRNVRQCRSCPHCTENCSEFEEEVCPRIARPPYVCNGCKEKKKCTLRKYEYRPLAAQDAYKRSLSESRQGFAVNPQELEQINALISPLIKHGQSVHHVCMANREEIPYCEKTIYRLLNEGAFDAGRIDCPRSVRLRPRKKPAEKKIDRHCYENRTYEDYAQFILDNPDVAIVQMDSVIGRPGGKVLLTMCFKTSNLLLAFLRDRNTARSVLDIINNLDAGLGREKFSELFTTILTDRGTEFSDPGAIERDINGEQRCMVFYCNPSSPYQKGSIEVSHELIRRILPKGSSFDHLQQEDIDLMLSHINSYKRKNLNNRSAYQVFSFLCGDELLRLLNIREIPPNEIILSPKLLKK